MRTRPERKSHHRRNRIIAEERTDTVFNDDRIRSLAAAHKLPTATDLKVLGARLRDAAWFFAHEVRIPNGNELNDEISDLYRLANRAFCVIESKGRSARLTSKGHNTLPVKTGIAEMFESLAKARENLSVEATELLNSHGTTELPSPNALRDVKQREAACRVIAELCSFGGSFVSGRRRPTGKRSRHHLRPLLYAPERSSGFAKRDAELNFIERLGFVWKEATGKSPPRTARHIDKPPTTLGEQAEARRRARARHTTLGPFPGFAKDCLTLAGVRDADVVELINELDRRRRALHTAERLSPSKS
jgi:hypothetical protein